MNARPSPYSFLPIATVESPFKEKFGTPRQPGLVPSVEGAIVLRSDLNPDAFDGLETFSHAWVIFVFHQSEMASVKTKVHPPRLGGKPIGVFATRSPHRPNSIGLSLVKIRAIEGRRLIVTGLDLVDGTPVLDIKPYLPSIEAKPEAVDGWTSAAVGSDLVLEWSEPATRNLAEAAAGDAAAAETLRQTLEDIIRLDPRPISYRGTKDAPDPYTATYGFRHGDWNVVYRMEPNGTAVFLRLEPFVARR